MLTVNPVTQFLHFVYWCFVAVLYQQLRTLGMLAYIYPEKVRNQAALILKAFKEQLVTHVSSLVWFFCGIDVGRVVGLWKKCWIGLNYAFSLYGSLILCIILHNNHWTDWKQARPYSPGWNTAWTILVSTSFPWGSEWCSCSLHSPLQTCSQSSQPRP